MESASSDPASSGRSQLIVTDSTALISLKRIGRLDLLPAVFPKVMAPPAVITEFGERPAWLRASGPVTIPAALNVFRDRLDVGEIEAIALAMEHPGSAVLLDERRGRQVAKRVGLDVIGTLGLLLLAKDEGIVAEVSPVLNDLTDAGFYLSDTLREEVLRLAGEAA